jgi:hypothetical protein
MVQATFTEAGLSPQSRPPRPPSQDLHTSTTPRRCRGCVCAPPAAAPRPPPALAAAAATHSSRAPAPSLTFQQQQAASPPLHHTSRVGSPHQESPQRSVRTIVGAYRRPADRRGPGVARRFRSSAGAPLDPSQRPPEGARLPPPAASLFPKAPV